MVAERPVTELLADLHGGRKDALNEIVPLVYAELHRLAACQLRNEHAFTVQPTALIHEAYLRLAAQRLPEMQSRAHFLGLAAHLMRQILVDHARGRMAAKRGAGARAVTLDRAVILDTRNIDSVVSLDLALQRLATVDERKGKVVEMRYFGGLGLDEIAEALGISVPTVTRDLRMGEAFLLRELHTGSAS
ncbi:MAG: sigma-70 family RNA polymerase sigma factor [Acidobacteria bacterium]|nr:sigma-70 family RNA polymerase sigma factor [Acidobacteriota bacterium]